MAEPEPKPKVPTTDPPLTAAGRDFHTHFARETPTRAQLDHPNIVPVSGTELRQGLPHLAMNYVLGKTRHHLPTLRQDLPAVYKGDETQAVPTDAPQVTANV